MLRFAVMPLLLGLAAASSQDPTPGIRQVAAAWAAACTKGDAKAAGAVYTMDALLLDSDGTTKAGQAAIAAHFAALLSGPLKGAKCSVSVAVVRPITTDIAVGQGTYSLAVPGQPIAKGLWQNTFVRQGAKWLIASDTGVMPPTK